MVTSGQTVGDNPINHKMDYVAQLLDLLNPKGLKIAPMHWFKSYNGFTGIGKWAILTRHTFLSLLISSMSVFPRTMLGLKLSNVFFQFLISVFHCKM